MRYDVRQSVEAPFRSGSRTENAATAPYNKRRGEMKRYTVYVSIVLLIGALSGCGAAARTIAASSISERSDVFTEVAGNEAAPSGYTDVLITASIKTHLEGYYPAESKTSAHGKETYPFLLNIDGQAVLWKAEGKKHELPEYVGGKTSKDPEAGEGIKYVLNKKIRLRPGSHKVFFGLPADDYHREAVINVKEGEAQTLEFKPEYKYKTLPTRIPTYMKGDSYYAILANGNPVAQ